MHNLTAAELVCRFWELFDREEWAAAGELLADDVAVEWLHSGEVIRGRDNVIGVNANYPGSSRIRILRVVGGADGPDGMVASEIEVVNGPDTFWAASFFTVTAGRIQQVREYWLDPPTEGPPAWRSAYTEQQVT